MKAKIYTKVGDKGETSLVSGSKVKKSHSRLELYGTLDELNSHLGLLVFNLETSQGLNQEKEFLLNIQHRLFQMGSLLACEKNRHEDYKLEAISKEHVLEIEFRIDKIEELLGPLTKFILPGGSEGASRAHISRTICRRLERLLCRFDEENSGELSSNILPFINRLSDYLFCLARLINKSEGVSDVFWRKEKLFLN